MSQFCLKWNNHVPNLLSVFENLKSMDTFVDVTLACEGRIVKAHKLVLSASSKFFHNLFLSNPCTHPVIIMHDVKYNILKAIIEFMYKGEINISQEHLEVLLKTAKTLDVKGLAEIGNESSRAQSCEPQNCSLQTTSQNASLLQESPQTVRKKRGRPRKRSCDSTYSNDDVVPFKIKDRMSPDIQELDKLNEPIDSASSLSFSTVIPVHQASSSLRVSTVAADVTPVISSSPKDSSEQEHALDRDFQVEPLKLLEQSLTTDQNQASPKQSFKSSETSRIDNLVSSCLAVPTDSLSSSHLLDPNDSEDCDIVDVKPQFVHQERDSEHAIRDSHRSSEYLNDNDLCTVFQRCRNPSQFAVNIARMLFTPDELRESNCRGVKDKSALDSRRLDFIRTSVMKFYNILPVYEIDIWKQCMQSIDSRCRHERRPKFKNAVISFGFTEEN